MKRMLIIVLGLVVGGGALLGVRSLRAQETRSGLRIYDIGNVCLYAEASNYGGLWGVTKTELGMGPSAPCPDGRSATPR